MSDKPGWVESYDVVVVGSGSAALSAALRVSAAGLSCKILEKSHLIGGTTAMSGAGTWIPANHHAARIGIQDSEEEAFEYLQATGPEGWHEVERPLWEAFSKAAPRTLQFIEKSTPLKFCLTDEPDVYPDKPGGKVKGRMLSTLPLSKWRVGKYAGKIRTSTLPHLFTYHELHQGDLFHHPVMATLRVLPKLIWRVLSRSRAQGSSLVTGLLRGCLDNGCEVELGARASRLLTTPEGRVNGVVVDHRGVLKRIEARVGVVIASGGFEWNAEMLERYFPGPLDWRGSPRSNEGDGHKMVEAVGGALDRMDQANVYPSIPTRYESQPHGLPIIFQAEKNAIAVNRAGNRFVDELDFNIGSAIDARDTDGRAKNLPAWVIADASLLSSALPLVYYASRSREWMVKADTVHSLAAKIGLSPTTLTETVKRWNEHCAAGHDPDFHRGESDWGQYMAGGPAGALGPIKKPPFLAIPFNRSILGTKGGARTNNRGQVLRPDATVISGLYAAGLSMANPIGTKAVAPGTTIGPNLTWGFICAESLIEEKKSGVRTAPNNVTTMKVSVL